ncbi:uncharacterized protein LOC117316479 [Pecten maximus]|uniref:uncharacterized protein LOC117316479 n=1 Tax=Pecten maximus TaxID=6579 RepID=UPI001458240C|nr:uncharacterized protein LOC117316479 [Pecten maximus]
MPVHMALYIIAVLCFIDPGWTIADDGNTHTQLLQRILSALEGEIAQLEGQHVHRELEANDALDDQLEQLAQILTRGSDKKLTNRKLVSTNVEQASSEEDIEKGGSEMTNENKDMVKKLILSIVKKTKHCGPLGEGEICADSHDCCCGYTCWKWRCRDKQQTNPNWWDNLHNRT